ncbi:hypothetical protein C9374_006334 [Naegleria lovaniensis]|uniref:UBC core domain-containing protein n=1 Tax=Naegleria lovaniensis TaxID=51637 RepID=A0AA88GNU1_NAELO|nr:uncharacterized protein C9374_006334 [Naegleria lovaniensis]KAG2381345.1 hypothetical protein C9374_006334 [Naegleria lovaniensis]
MSQTPNKDSSHHHPSTTSSPIPSNTASSIIHNFGKSRFWPSNWFQSGLSQGDHHHENNNSSSEVQRDLQEIEQILVKTLEEELKKSNRGHSIGASTDASGSSSSESGSSTATVSSVCSLLGAGEALHQTITTTIKREIKTTEDIIDREVRLWLSSCKNDSNCPLSPIFTPKLKSVQDIFSMALQGKNLQVSKQSSAYTSKKKQTSMEEPDIKYYGIDEKEKLVHFSIDNETFFFDVTYPSKYGEKTNQRLRVKIDYKRMRNSHSQDKKHPFVSNLQITSHESEVDDEPKEATPTPVSKLDDQQALKFYKMVWGDDNNGSLPLSMDSRKYIMKELYKIIKNEENTKKEGFSVRPIGDNPFVWEVRLFGFPEDSLLAKDLNEHAKKFDTNNTDVVLEVKFPATFPSEAPFIRVIRPRFEIFTGQVSFGGTFCIDSLNNNTWSGKKSITMESVILSIRQSLIDNGARVDMRTYANYDAMTASRAYTRLKRSEAQTLLKYPTMNSFRDDLICYSATYAKELYSNDLTVPSTFEFGNHSCMILPDWIMKCLFIKEGVKLNIRCVSLNKGTYIKLQPHSKDFYKMQNHKALLENALRNFSTLNEGMSIPVVYGRKTHFIEVLECEPDYSICVISDPYLDIKVDFAPALDFSEEDEKQAEKNDSTTKPQVESSSTATAQPPVIIDNVDMVECENCKRAVSKRTYVMHLPHCKRNVYNCAKCNQVVKLNERESHEAQFHQECECTECHQTMDKSALEEHLTSECQFRIVICKYCDLALAFCDLHEHETTCGNQTIYCPHAVFILQKPFMTNTN